MDPMAGLALLILAFFWIVCTEWTIACAILCTARFFPDRRRGKFIFNLACWAIVMQHALLLAIGEPWGALWLTLMFGSRELFLPPSPILPITIFVFFLPLLSSRLRWFSSGSSVFRLRVALFTLLITVPPLLLLLVGLFLLSLFALAVGIMLANFLYEVAEAG